MTSKTVAKPVGLFQRDGVYCLRVMIPNDLQPAYGGRTKVVESLGTRDRAEAQLLAARKRAKYLEEFHTERRVLNPETTVLTPELGSSIAQALRAVILRADDNMRSFPEAAEGLLARDGDPQALTFFDGPPLPVTLEGRTPRQMAALQSFNATSEAQAVTALASRNFAEAAMWADGEARRRGLLIDWTTPGARQVLLECLQVMRTAWADVRRRDQGEVVEVTGAVVVAAPVAVPAATRTANQRTLRDAYDAWTKKPANRPQKTLNTYLASLVRWESAMGLRDLTSYTRADGSTFESKLLEAVTAEEISATTASHILGHAQTLFNRAVKDGWLDRSPLVGLTIQGGRSSRQPWSADQMVKLFDSPLFTAYALPSFARAGMDAAYWLPLLGAYTGARPSELAQLWTDDVSEGQGGLVVEFRDNTDRGQSLKNTAAWRATPLHSALIALGFRDYWLAVSKHGPGPLFPAVTRMKNQTAASKFGEWFTEYKRAQGFTDSSLTLHSFRHSVETELGLAGVSPTLVDAITGHAGKGIGRKVYGATIRREAERLRPAVETLHYPGLLLPRVFSAPAWKPSKQSGHDVRR